MNKLKNSYFHEYNHNHTILVWNWKYKHSVVQKQEIRMSLLSSVVQSPSHVWLFVTQRTTACQASLSLTISRSLSKFMSIALVMPSSHLILRCPLLLLPSIFPSIRDFSNKLTILIRWPKYWSFSFSISLSENSGLISLKIKTGLIFSLSKGLSGVFSNTTVQSHQFWGALPFLQSAQLSKPYMTTGRP